MKIYDKAPFLAQDLKGCLSAPDSDVRQSVSEDVLNGYISPEHFHKYTIFFKEYCAKLHRPDVDDALMKKAWMYITAELPLLVYTRPTDGEEGAIWNTLKADEKRNFITMDETAKAHFCFEMGRNVTLSTRSRYYSPGQCFYRGDSGEKAYRAHSVIYAKTLIRWLTLYHAAVTDFLCDIRNAMTAVGCNNMNVPWHVSELFRKMDAEEPYVGCNVTGLTVSHRLRDTYSIANNITVVGSKEDMQALDAMLKKVEVQRDYERRLINTETIQNEVAEAQLLGLFTGEGTGVPKYGSLMPIAWECSMGYVFPSTTYGTSIFNHMNFVPLGQTQAAQAKFKQISKKLVIYGAAMPSVGILVTSAGFVQVDDLDNPQTFELMSPETLAVMLGLKTFEQFSLERNTKGFPTALIHESRDRYFRIAAVYKALRQHYFNQYISRKYRPFDVNVGHDGIVADVSKIPLQDVSPQVFAGLPCNINTKKCWKAQDGFSIHNFSLLTYVAYLMDIIHSLMSCNDLRFYKNEKLSSTEKYSSFDDYIKDALTKDDLGKTRVTLVWTVHSSNLEEKGLSYVPQSAINKIYADTHYTMYTPIGVGDTYDNWEIPVIK